MGSGPRGTSPVSNTPLHGASPAMFAIQVAPGDEESAAPEHMLQSHWTVLCELEYVLRMCHLEMRDEMWHMDIGVRLPHFAISPSETGQ